MGMMHSPFALIHPKYDDFMADAKPRLTTLEASLQIAEDSLQDAKDSLLEALQRVEKLEQAAEGRVFRFCIGKLELQIYWRVGR